MVLRDESIFAQEYDTMSLLGLEPGLLDPDSTVFIVTPLRFPPNKYQDLL